MSNIKRIGEIGIQTSDEQVHPCTSLLLQQCRTIKNIADLIETDEVVPLPNLETSVWLQIVDLTENYSSEKIRKLTVEEQNTLMLGCDYLEHEILLNRIIQEIAISLKELSLEELMHRFTFTPEAVQERTEQLKTKLPWLQ